MPAPGRTDGRTDGPTSLLCMKSVSSVVGLSPSKMAHTALAWYGPISSHVRYLQQHHDDDDDEEEEEEEEDDNDHDDDLRQITRVVVDAE
jgi:hypothetical protein